MAIEGIIRNRLKIEAIIKNMRLIESMRKSLKDFANWVADNHPLTKEEWVKLFKEYSPLPAAKASMNF